MHLVRFRKDYLPNTLVVQVEELVGVCPDDNFSTK